VNFPKFYGISKKQLNTLYLDIVNIKKGIIKKYKKEGKEDCSAY
jgi:hypothetical protein